MGEFCFHCLRGCLSPPQQFCMCGSVCVCLRVRIFCCVISLSRTLELIGREAVLTQTGTSMQELQKKGSSLPVGPRPVICLWLTARGRVKRRLLHLASQLFSQLFLHVVFALFSGAPDSPPHPPLSSLMLLPWTESWENERTGCRLRMFAPKESACLHKIWSDSFHLN